MLGQLKRYLIIVQFVSNVQSNPSNPSYGAREAEEVRENMQLVNEG
jgi:hypothetical protein